MFDVIIVGAGIPGLYAARELAKAGKKIVIIDKSRTSGDPNYSTAGIPIETIKDFDLPLDGINSELNKFIFGTQSNEVEKVHPSTYGYVLDFRKTKQILSDQVIALGGSVIWGESFVDLIKDNEKIVGIKTNKNKYRSKYIIDASGSLGVIAKKVGLRDPSKDIPSVGEEYIVQVKDGLFDKFKNTLCIYFDTVLAPYGYAWVFDNGNNTFKVGVIEFWADPKRKLPSIDERLNKFLKWIGEEKVEKILEKHGGVKFISPKVNGVYKENVLAIGDVIGAINPLFAEGIRPGLVSAKFAVDAILKEDVGQFAKNWNRYIGWKWSACQFFAKLFYSLKSQKAFEAGANVTKKYLTSQTIIDWGFNYKFETIPLKPISALKFFSARFF